MLNGFELHVYNRCEMYGNLEKLFGLEPQMFPCDDDSSGSGSGGGESKECVTIENHIYQNIEMKLILGCITQI